MHPLAALRARAYARDCVRYLAIAAATAPLGAVAGVARERGRLREFAWGVSAVGPVVATVLAARAESRSGMTGGKRSHDLRVVSAAGGSAGAGRCLLRNVVKIAVPWQLGHLVAVEAAFGELERRDPLTVTAAVVSYLLPAMMIASVFAGEGRPVHDRLAGTRVVTGPAPGSPAGPVTRDGGSHARR